MNRLSPTRHPHMRTRRDRWMVGAVMAGVVLSFNPPQAVAQCSNTKMIASKPNLYYRNNNDGTVDDLRTGLTWDRCVWGLTNATCTGGETSLHTWAQALTIPEQANLEVYKNASNWRLPSVKELESLTETCRSTPAINTVFFPSTPANVVWTGSPSLQDTALAWTVQFAEGKVLPAARDGRFAVRLVRDTDGTPVRVPPPPPSPTPAAEAAP